MYTVRHGVVRIQVDIYILVGQNMRQVVFGSDVKKAFGYSVSDHKPSQVLLKFVPDTRYVCCITKASHPMRIPFLNLHPALFFPFSGKAQREMATEIAVLVGGRIPPHKNIMRGVHSFQVT